MSSKFKAIAELSLPEIDKKVREARLELLELNLKKKTGQLETSHLLKDLRRNIARYETAAKLKRTEASA